MKNSARWIGGGLFALLIALFVYENGVLLQAELRFTADCERDLFLVYGLSHEGTPPHTGIRVAALGWDLGPLYHLAVAPFVSLDPSPMTVHWFNLVICVFGLIAFWRWASVEFGPAPALLTVLLYTQSSGHVAFVDTIWHVGATPGIIFGLIAAAGTWLRTGRTLPLAVAGALLTILVQLHSLGLVYGPAAIALLFVGRDQLRRRSVAVLLTTVAITALPLLLYLIPSFSDPVMGAARHDGGFELDLQEFGSTLLALLEPRYLLEPAATRFCVLLLLGAAVAGAVTDRVGPSNHPPTWRQLSLVLGVQVLVGGFATASVISYELVGRYFLPVIIPLFTLAGLGAARIDRWLAARGRVASGRALTFAAVAGGLALVGESQVPVLNTLPTLGTELETQGRLDYLLAEEQEAVVSYLVEERGLAWNQMRGRVHGALFGPNAGVRYLERIVRDHRGTPPPLDHLDSHWRVLVEGQAVAPVPQVLETVRLKQRTRTLILERFRPNYDPSTVTVSARRCSWPFPYIWSQSTVEQLALVGFPRGHGPDIHHCMGDADPAPIRLRLAPDSVALTIELSLDGEVALNDVTVTAHAEGAPDLPVALQPLPALSKARFVAAVPMHDGWRDVSITINRKRTLGFLDVY